MTVKELIDCLMDYDGNAEIVIRPAKSDYVSTISATHKTDIRSSWSGEKRSAVIISGGEQTGTI